MTIKKSISLNSIQLLDSVITKSQLQLLPNYFKNSVIKPYFIINKGGFGIVFNCHHYAIKMIPFLVNKDTGITALSDKIKNKVKEVRCLSDLNHCNIIRYYDSWIELGNCLPDIIRNSDNLLDFYEKDNVSDNKSFYSNSLTPENISSGSYLIVNIFIKMELMNVSLREYVWSTLTTYSRKDIFFIINNILEGVSYLHNKNIIHCDLKPENILLNINREGKIINLKIADFGLVITKDYPEINTHNGTLSYIPFKPEPLTISYDIYSLGIIFYELLHLKTTIMETKINCQQFKLNRNSDYPIINQMIHPNYQLRPSIKHIQMELK